MILKKNDLIKKRIERLKKSLTNNTGITLMETVVALGILILGIIASLSLTTSSISFSQTSEQIVVVVNLAKEGIEIVRTIRDFSKIGDFSLLPNGASGFFDNPVNGYYIIDAKDNFNLKNSITQMNFEQINQCLNCKLYQNTTDNQYSHSITGNETIFRRAIKIEQGDSSNEKTIVSKVYWSERGREHTFILEDHLTNW